MDDYMTPVLKKEYLMTDSSEKSDKLMKSRRQYIKQIVEECGTARKRPLNVGIIGTYGAGKSSFINTVAAALNGRRWREHAGIGDYGGTRGVTTYVQRFPKCCQGENAKYIDVSLPALVDIAGFQDEDSKCIKEVLRIFFFGKLGHEDALQEAMVHYAEHGIEGLKEKYSINVRDKNVYKLDRIIFVASARQKLPEYLIECVVNAAQPTGSSQDRHKRAIPIFGVLTHAGPMETENVAELNEISKQFMRSLGIAQHRLLLCSNYCDSVDGGSRVEMVLPELDVPVLKFLVQICDHSLSVLHDDEMYDIAPKHGWSFLELPGWIALTPTLLAGISCAVVVIALVYYLLTMKVKDTHDNYQHYRKY